MTQPAFSQLIRELEVALRVKLFERTTRHIELTETGRRLLPMVEPPLEDLGDAFKFVRDMAAGTRGRITFASLPSVAFGLVTHAFAHFKARYPAIAVRLTEDQNLILIDRVLHREVDFGIGTPATPHKELVFRELLQDELQVVYPAGHALAANRRIPGATLRTNPWCCCPDNRACAASLSTASRCQASHVNQIMGSLIW